MNEIAKNLGFIYCYNPHRPKLYAKALFSGVELTDWFMISLCSYNIATDMWDNEVYYYEVQQSNIR